MSVKWRSLKQLCGDGVVRPRTEHVVDEERRQRLVADRVHRQRVARDRRPRVGRSRRRGRSSRASRASPRGSSSNVVGSHRDVVGAVPVDGVLALGVPDDVRVLGAPSRRLRRRPRGERATGRRDGLPCATASRIICALGTLSNTSRPRAVQTVLLKTHSRLSGSSVVSGPASRGGGPAAGIPRTLSRP